MPHPARCSDDAGALPGNPTLSELVGKFFARGRSAPCFDLSRCYTRCKPRLVLASAQISASRLNVSCMFLALSKPATALPEADPVVGIL